MDITGWEKMYRSGERGSEGHPTILLVETIAHMKAGTAIDLACGTGRNALYLAERGWDVTAVDGSQTAIDILREQARERHLAVQAEVRDLTHFSFGDSTYDLIVIAYYLQRDLLSKLGPALNKGGCVLAIVHIPEPGEPSTEKRAAPGELRHFFEGWTILHDYEGPSRDPAHRRPVAEIVAQTS